MHIPDESKKRGYHIVSNRSDELGHPIFAETPFVALLTTKSINEIRAGESWVMCVVGILYQNLVTQLFCLDPENDGALKYEVVRVLSSLRGPIRSFYAWEDNERLRRFTGCDFGIQSIQFGQYHWQTRQIARDELHLGLHHIREIPVIEAVSAHQRHMIYLALPTEQQADLAARMESEADLETELLYNSNALFNDLYIHEDIQRRMRKKRAEQLIDKGLHNLSERVREI